MTKVSVIVPIYNSEKHLRECLDSLVNQTIDDIEIILIDDASIDNSLSIMKEYSKYPNVYIYHNDTNLGQGPTRNIGIKLSRGEYIGFVDSDDYVNTNMYKTMYDASISNNKPDIISTKIKFILDSHENYDDYDLKGYLCNIKKYPSIILHQSPSVCNKLFKRELIQNYRFLNTIFEDVAFTYTNLFKADNILIMNTTDYFYRRDITSGISSISYHPTNRVLDIFVVADEITNELSRKERKRYKKYIKYIQLMTSLQRINEIENWHCKDIIGIKKLMYKLIFKKYGDLSDIDISLLSSSVSQDTIYEYSNYVISFK